MRRPLRSILWMAQDYPANAAGDGSWSACVGDAFDEFGHGFWIG